MFTNLKFNFGTSKFKHAIEKSPQSDMNHSVLIIPLLCGKLTEQKIIDTLNNVK